MDSCPDHLMLMMSQAFLLAVLLEGKGAEENKIVAKYIFMKERAKSCCFTSLKQRMMSLQRSLYPNGSFFPYQVLTFYLNQDIILPIYFSQPINTIRNITLFFGYPSCSPIYLFLLEFYIISLRLTFIPGLPKHIERTVFQYFCKWILTIKF